MAFELPDLPYAYDSLGPYMSAETLEFHHDKHHQAYVTNGNNLLEGSGLEGKSPPTSTGGIGVSLLLSLSPGVSVSSEIGGSSESTFGPGVSVLVVVPGRVTGISLAVSLIGPKQRAVRRWC